MTAGFSLRSAGFWLEAVAPYGDVQTTWAWGSDGGGLGSVEWQMDVAYDFDHPALRRGARVEVMDGAQRVGQATLGEPGRTDAGRSFSAIGVYRQAENFLCFDADLETTTVADTAIDEAHSRGCVLRRDESITTNPMNTDDVTEGLNYLGPLLTSVAVETGQRWWVDADCFIHMDDDQTTPTWHVVPGVSDPGTADDQYASALFGRYRSGADVLTATTKDEAAAQRWGDAEFGVDLTPFGSISEARADNRLAGLLKRGKSRLTFTDRLEVDANQLLTAGGRPASLSMVRGGHVVRVYGLSAYSQWLDGKSWLDFVIGEAIWANGADTVTIAPVDLASRTYEDLLAGNGSTALNA